ncbi:hypothetical protein [Methylobacterium ajmalii]|jgi:hypothetical protein|uniref:hypothetical protein n=1 Tax=Methylobacterium ajmalii TaxID=2738439 RepID=UPI00190BBF0C|nr:hypothetical protein [Methylobacterium ajmalii]MBK3400444.1 hypothetical protein [Methylobacterium ajmalii]MBK3407514.1 hypothetical protein [Methylobacterium ajmalii]MBK3422138.1 hypothetical protein [Methylobacterium ajmalii]MBZ6416655.1 hypothetical protein [Methylobacterium sp.]
MNTIETLPARVHLDWEVAPKPLAEVNENLRARVRELEEQAQVAAVRHQMAQAFVQMQIMGYSALQNYGINYHDLPAYKDPDGLLEKAAEVPLLDGQEHYLEYCRRVEHDIAAAVRRKQFVLRNGGKAFPTNG